MAGGTGYVKLWRSILDSEQMTDDWLCRLFIWCILRANYEPTRFRGQILAAGQFVTGRLSASAELRVSPSKWYRGVERLQEMGAITLLANSNWTTITICNWKTYQEVAPSKRTADEQAADSERTADDTTSEQPADTDKEGKKGRREETLGRARTFKKPTAQEVDAYCQLRSNGITGEEFVSSYERIGWVIGRNRTPMRDWKAAVRYWEVSRKKQLQTAKPQSRVPTDEDLEHWRPTPGGH